MAKFWGRSHPLFSLSMSLETVALIGILTLLTICLGTDLFWVLVIRPALRQVSDQTFLEMAPRVYGQAVKMAPLVCLTILIFALILNTVATTRSEPYLLRIGLISLFVYLVCILISIIQANPSVLSAAKDSSSTLTIQDLQTQFNRIFWLRLPSMLVCYWSFLHYAMNPKV